VNCDDFKRLMGDILDDEVARDLYAEVKGHLAACGPCSVEVDTLRKTILIYRGSAPDLPLTEGARQRLFATLSFEYRNRKPNPSS
jgi:hypothetical protein